MAAVRVAGVRGAVVGVGVTLGGGGAAVPRTGRGAWASGWSIRATASAIAAVIPFRGWAAAPVVVAAHDSHGEGAQVDSTRAARAVQFAAERR